MFSHNKHFNDACVQSTHIFFLHFLHLYKLTSHNLQICLFFLDCIRPGFLFIFKFFINSSILGKADFYYSLSNLTSSGARLSIALVDQSSNKLMSLLY